MIGGPSQCLADGLVMELVQGRLFGEALERVEEHLAECANCRTVVAETASCFSVGRFEAPHFDTSAPTRPLRGHGHHGHHESPPLAPDARVGRYELRELIGAGGLGIVYAAHDPELHRMVALKVLRSQILPVDATEDLRTRLLREARAMAQLSHPNVVTVYDAGTYDEGVFLAMELVDGTTLRRWLTEGEPPLCDIVARFRAAGEGLAAAHRIGLVHRDFKPENVLVGSDGRVRVTDFGLARPVRWEATRAGEPPATPRTWAGATLTRTGIFAGTPAYMAPEQLAGQAADPRSDQFGFCVALHEALYGQRPFAGGSVEEIANAVLSGQMQPPPANSVVPPQLRAVILRGLSLRPEQRYASMEALLLAIAQVRLSVPRRRWRPALVGLAAATTLAAGVVAVSSFTTRSRPASSTVEATAAPPAATTASSVAKPKLEPRAPATQMPLEPAARPPKRRRLAKPKAEHAEVAPREALKPATSPLRVGDGLRDPFQSPRRASDAR